MATSASPWGGGASGSPWGGGKRKTAPTPPQPAGQTPPAPQAPQTFAQMQAAGQARPAPPQTTVAANYSPGGATIDGGGLPAQTHAATGNMAALMAQMNDPRYGSGPSVSSPQGGGTGLQALTAEATGGKRTPSGPTDTGGYNPVPPSTGGPTVGGPGTTGPGGTTPPPGYQINQQTPGISDSLTAATQKALANPDPYATDVMQAQRAAGQAQLTQSFGAQQKMLDEEMARRGIGASSIASGYYGDLAGQQATAQAGLESNILTDEANRQQQGLASALGAGNQLYGAQASSGLGYSQLGLQNALGQGQLGLGQQQLNNQNTQFGQNLDQQLKLGTMSDTTANRGIDVQNQTNVNQNELQIMTLLAQIGGSGDNKALADAVAKLLGQKTGGTPGTGNGYTPPPSGGSTDPGGSLGTTGTNGGTQTPGEGNGYTPPPGVPWTPKTPTETPEGGYNPKGATLGGLPGATSTAVGGGAPPAGDSPLPTGGLVDQTQAAIDAYGGKPPVPQMGNDGKPLPTGVQQAGTATSGVQLNTNDSGQAASGGPIEDQLLSMTPAQSQDVYGFALSRKPSDYESLGTAGANGFINGVGNTTPGETVMRDKTTGHMMPLSKLKSQAWWTA